MQILIDGDWIVYAAGFAGQKTEYCTPDRGPEVYATKTELAQRVVAPDAKPADIPDTVRVFSRIVVDEPSHVFHSAKKMIHAACEAVTQRYPQGSPHPSPRIFIGGPGNFRERIATIRPYKGTRVAAKPVMYAELRDYLVRQWNAKTVYGVETDDVLAAELTEHGGIIVGVDKDFLQVPGLHYNPNKGFANISEDQGEVLLYRQVLTGDSVDNIGGCYKCGPKRAAELIKPGQSRGERDDACYMAYVDSVNLYGLQVYNDIGAREAMRENFELVRLLRSYEEIDARGGSIR